MGYKAELRAMQAAERRQEREAQKRVRELERHAKEQAKLSTIEQARLEVETHESRLDLLLSVHKEQGPTWDWSAVAASLPPHRPEKSSYHEFRAKQRAALLQPDQREASISMLEHAQAQDEEAYQRSLTAYARDKAEWEKLRHLSRRILAGEPQAYSEALVELSPLAEISDLGSTLHFTVHDTHLLECILKVNGVQAIPAEVKTLTSTGKLSVKTIPKARFHELYQDYICSCMLRVAREVFALLPVDALLITASAELTDLRKGQPVEQPVLSAAITRPVLEGFDIEGLDPSDAMEAFLHRGDFKASRKAGAFAAIAPLTPADIQSTRSEQAVASDLLLAVRSMREEFKAEITKLTPVSTTPTN
ncbi:MAG: hypothetical protein NT154_19695 [Verrucomicrobia bacterium]|nr:hypothetical protein [Verrucomicrobiota bacterium]